MLIDLILDRAADTHYNPKMFYLGAMAYKQDEVSRAMDEGTENDVKKALCDYIKRNEYNRDICAYIESVSWLDEWTASGAYADCLWTIETAKTADELNEAVETIADCDEITHREYSALYAIALIHSRSID